MIPGLTLAGVVFWLLAFWWGPVPDFFDQRNKHLLRVLGGALCFGLAGFLWLLKAVS